MKKEELEKLAEELRNKENATYNEIRNKKNEIEEIRIELLKYRVQSVKRILEFMSSAKDDKGNSITFLNGITLNTLAVHCQNKLNGNIDGIEITLDRGIKKTNTF